MWKYFGTVNRLFNFLCQLKMKKRKERGNKRNTIPLTCLKVNLTKL